VALNTAANRAAVSPALVERVLRARADRSR
jgi:hypothetical protein